jgi:hypothetical protein
MWRDFFNERPLITTPEEFEKLGKEEVEKWRSVVTKYKIAF